MITSHRRLSAGAPVRSFTARRMGAKCRCPIWKAAAADFDFRKWLADQGPGEMAGPQVRAAGRIVLHRDKGKLQFIDIRDMTGQIQLFVGQQQVGDDWELAKCLDLGDIIGVDGELRRTKTGELSIFAKRLHDALQEPRRAAGEAPRAHRSRAPPAAAVSRSDVRRRRACSGF